MDGLMENPIKMDDSGVPLFLETSVLVEPLGGIGRCFFSWKCFYIFSDGIKSSPVKLSWICFDDGFETDSDLMGFMICCFWEP